MALGFGGQEPLLAPEKHMKHFWRHRHTNEGAGAVGARVV